jgi:replicative DNA helicase Mcm
VSEAIREKPGEGKIVRGTVVSVSSPFKVTFKIVYRCPDCRTTNEGHSTTRGPMVYPLLQMQKPSKCINCGEKDFEIDESRTEMDDAKIITLQNMDLSNGDQVDETLEVLLMGDNTKYTRAGEVVTINGNLKCGISNNGIPGKYRKTITLMDAKFVTYEDRKSFVITERDEKAFYRFVSINEDTIIQRLVSMTAPNIIGEFDGKLGGLRSIVGGDGENKRGRIHSLYVGDKGLGKTSLVREITKMHPNCRFITAHSASSISALGIVDSDNDTKTLIYGPIPLSSGALVGIDELQTWTHDEQGILLGVMEEGEIYLLKYGKNRPIIALTTILATVNPQDIRYVNRTSISKGEISILPLRISTQRIAHLNTNALQQLHSYFVSTMPRPYDRQLIADTFAVDDAFMDRTLTFQNGGKYFHH